MSEQVLVVPAESINFYDDFKNGWAEFPDNEFVLAHLLESALFMDREKAEIDPNFKQIIPYCIVKDATTKRYFCYQRNKKGAENRLHSKYSCGTGGHINPEDIDNLKRFDGNQAYFKGLCRELQEELGFTKQSFAGQTLGFIYDDSNEVGKVHFGVAVLIQPLSALFKANPEDTMANYEYKYHKDMLAMQDSFENWSKIVLNHAGLS